MMHGLSSWIDRACQIRHNHLYGAPAFERPPEAEPMFINSSALPVEENHPIVRKMVTLFRLTLLIFHFISRSGVPSSLT
jgi:hypothetical protein